MDLRWIFTVSAVVATSLLWIFSVSAVVAILAVAARSFLRPGKMTTPSGDTGSRREDVQDLRDEEDQEDIFLSHSGRQKNFAEHLNDALRRANQTVFLDKHTLPIASPFPANIKKALRGCKLGVLVLSEDFLTSKWPMVELGILFENGIEVLPLFFKLNTDNLKSPKNLSRWRKKWKTMAKNQQQLEHWENAVKRLHTVNGIVYKHQEGEVAYIKKVVTKICNFIRPFPIYDQSNIQGSRALAEEIAGHFGKLDRSNQQKRACVVGLHGVGGQGKTTLCKTMVNFFHSKYVGRSSYIEFPTDCDERKVVEECKKAMKQLFGLGEESLKVDCFDQVVGLMKQHVKKLDLFLGIDNIWEHSIEHVGRLLNVGFSANSKVLLTSRSEGVLQTLLSGAADTSNYYHHLDSLPAPDDEDAFQIFQQSVKHDGFFASSSGSQFKGLLYRCRYDGKYHPLALKALGTYASRLCGLGNSKRSRPDWHSILEKLHNAELQSVDDAIRLNYESLDEVQQHIFLDIALGITNHEGQYGRRLHADTCWWLHVVYRELCEIDIRAHIHDLAMAGVIDIGNTEDIKVHDVYKDLAWKEAARSPRFVTSLEEAVEGKERGNVKRVILLERRMPSLCVLNLKELVHLEYLKLHVSDCCSDVKFGGENALQNLRVFSISGCAGLEDVDSLRHATQLKFVFIEFCENLKRLPDLGALSGLEVLELSRNSSLEELGCLSPALKLMTVHDCGALKRIPDLRGVTGLEKLDLWDNYSLKEVGCLSPALKEMRVLHCHALERIPDLRGVTGLEVLVLIDIRSLEEVGCLSPALKELDVRFCAACKRVPDLAGLTGLESLCLYGNASLEEWGCLSPALKDITITGNPALKTIPDLGGLTRLQSLVLRKNESLQEVGDLNSLSVNTLAIVNCRKVATLDMLRVRGRACTMETCSCIFFPFDRFDFNGHVQDVRFEKVGTLRTLDVGGFSKLVRLEVAKCEALEEIQGLNNLSELQEIVLHDCGRLKDTHGQLTMLRTSHVLLRISECPGLSGL